MSKHYIFKIEQYLESINQKPFTEQLDKVKDRKSGKKFTNEEHLNALVYALLSNQTKWSNIAPKLELIDKIFFNYDLVKVKSTDFMYFVDELKKIKCGNRVIMTQMKGLKDSITLYEEIINEYGSIDDFITLMPAQAIVSLISNNDSIYKIPNVGTALAWEYLRNVGIDGIKPDVHMNRFLGNKRLGNSKYEISTPVETIKQAKLISQETGKSLTEIDSIIWMYCADNYGAICTANPKCDRCVIKDYCKNKERN